MSKNWQDLLQDAIGSRELDASAIKEYFKPLTDFLDEEQAKYNYTTEIRSAAFEDFYSKGEDDSTTPSKAHSQHYGQSSVIMFTWIVIRVFVAYY